MTFEGQYLTYAEYQELGGSAIGRMPFNLLEFEARKIIDLRTQNRLENETEIPFAVKICDFHLINKVNSYAEILSSSNGLVSFNTDGYSESYASPAEIKEIVSSKQKELEYILRTDLTDVIVNNELLLFDGVKK